VVIPEIDPVTTAWADITPASNAAEIAIRFIIVLYSPSKLT
jgi:hypothetical protein